MRKAARAPRPERFGLWLANSRLGEAIFVQHARKAVFLFVLLTHSLYWATAWWSPWPYLIFTLVGIWFGGGIIAPWRTILRRAQESHFDGGILTLTVPFIALNYVAFFACLYMFGSVLGPKGQPTEGMWEHFYFSAVTLTTLGYGNSVPADRWTEAVATVEALVGFFGFAVLAGVVASVAIQRADRG